MTNRQTIADLAAALRVAADDLRARGTAVPGRNAAHQLYRARDLIVAAKALLESTLAWEITATDPDQLDAPNGEATA